MQTYHENLYKTIFMDIKSFFLTINVKLISMKYTKIIFYD